MAWCAANVNLSNSCFGMARIGIVQPRHRHGMNRTWQRPPKHYSLKLSRRDEKKIIRCRDSSAETDTGEPSGNGSEMTIPSSAEVEYLLSEICDTSVTEFELKLDGFRLYVSREVTSKTKPSPSAEFASLNTNGFVSASLAISKSEPSSHNIQTFLDRAADDGLVIIKSPKVGIFRRSRTRKNKTLPPACVENQIVKEGRIIGFIQQMSIHSPVKTNVSGQVVKILKENGEPVGYGDPIIAILPSFPGIKKLLK